MSIKLKILLLTLIFTVNNQVLGATSENSYFATLKSSKVNMRTGPGTEYPIKWIYTYQNLPVAVIGQFAEWKKVRDILGDEGWIIASLLNNKHFIIVMNETMGYRYPNTQKKPIMKIGKLVVMKLTQCQEKWCQVKYNKHYAWIEKKDIWGIK